MIATTPASELGSKGFYLMHQIFASSILAIVGILLGLLVAAMIWGRTRSRLSAVRKENEHLRNEWHKLGGKD